RPKLRRRSSHTLRNCAQQTAAAREQRHNAVGFAKLLRAQHDAFFTVQGHGSSIPQSCCGAPWSCVRIGRVIETFKTPLLADLIAVGTGSLQGAVFAAGFRRIDLLGVALIGVATGIGGGFLRDILLGVTPAAFSNNYYLLVSIGAALIGMMLPRLFQRLDPLVNLLDAISIGMFGAIGTTKALSMGLPVVPSLFIGTIAAVGGGALRDV